MAEQYCGYQTVGGADFGANNDQYCFGGTYDLAQYTIPGSGTMTVVELAAYCAGASGYIRCALYETAGNTLLCQHSAKVAQSTTGWTGSAQALTGTTSIAAGTTVKILTNISGNAPILYSAGSGSLVDRCANSFTYYDDGFPASLPNITGDSFRQWNLRCGVNSAGEAVIPVLIFPGMDGGFNERMSGGLNA